MAEVLPHCRSRYLRISQSGRKDWASRNLCWQHAANLPIVYLNDEGIVAPAAILRGKNKIIPTLVSQLQKRTEGYQKIRLAVMHADALERAEELKEAIEAAFPGVAIPIDEFTPVMGAHAGPGLLGLGYLYE